jgi:hypothetical protein
LTLFDRDEASFGSFHHTQWYGVEADAFCESFGFALRVKAIGTSVLAGDAQGGGSPLVGGAGCIDACQRFLLACSVLPAWGERAPPRLSPLGETGKGDQSPCCRRLILAT